MYELETLMAAPAASRKAVWQAVSRYLDLTLSRVTEVLKSRIEAEERG